MQTDEETIETRVTGNYQVNSSLTADLSQLEHSRQRALQFKRHNYFDAQISHASIQMRLWLDTFGRRENTNEGLIRLRPNQRPLQLSAIRLSVRIRFTRQQERSFNISVAPDLDSTIYSLALILLRLILRRSPYGLTVQQSQLIFYSDPRERTSVSLFHACWVCSISACAEKLQPATFSYRGQ